MDIQRGKMLLTHKTIKNIRQHIKKYKMYNTNSIAAGIQN